MKCFINDNDGLSITETLALFFSFIYLIIIIVLLTLLLQNKLEQLHIEFLQACSWPIYTILGGYFGDRIVSKLGPVNLTRRRKVSGTNDQKGENTDVSDEPRI